jgi:hypothetical protein
MKINKLTQKINHRLLSVVFSYLLVILIPTVAIIFGFIAVGKNNKKSSKKRK